MRYSNLIGELAKRKVSKEKISECLKIHRNSVTYKLNGGTFSVGGGCHGSGRHIFPRTLAGISFRHRGAEGIGGEDTW